jgi:DNA-binding NarL/FixJ family response regulator
MSNLILLISDNSTVDRQLRHALTCSAPVCRLKLTTKRAEIEPWHTPGLVLLDMMLAQEPALDILRWFRAEPRYEEVPVFVLAPKTVNVNDAYALGANSCLLHSPDQEGLGHIAHGIAAYASLIAGSEGARFTRRVSTSGPNAAPGLQ